MALFSPLAVSVERKKHQLPFDFSTQMHFTNWQRDQPGKFVHPAAGFAMGVAQACYQG